MPANGNEDELVTYSKPYLQVPSTMSAWADLPVLDSAAPLKADGFYLFRAARVKVRNNELLYSMQRQLSVAVFLPDETKISCELTLFTRMTGDLAEKDVVKRLESVSAPGGLECLVGIVANITRSPPPRVGMINCPGSFGAVFFNRKVNEFFDYKMDPLSPYNVRV